MTSVRQVGREGPHARGRCSAGGPRPRRGRPHALLVLICERALFALTGVADARWAAFTNLKRWLKASDGRHGLVVAADPERLPPAYRFFELRLLPASPRSGGVRRGPRFPPAPVTLDGNLRGRVDAAVHQRFSDLTEE